MFKDSFRDVINKFANIHFDQINDNVRDCKYFNLDELKKASCTSNTSNTFSLLHVNIVSLDKNIDKIKKNSLIFYG